MIQKSTRSCQIFLAMTAAFYLLASTASAATITVFTNTTAWLESTTTDVVPLNANWLGVGTLPAVGTYSLTPVADSSSYDLVAGSTMIGSGSGVRYFRTTFYVPEFSLISADFQGSFDNGAQIFVNGISLALEGTISSLNFDDGIHHRIFVDNGGSVTNGYLGGDSFDSFADPFLQTNWVNGGSNEVILAIRNNPPFDSGRFSFGLTIQTTPVPEPSTALMLTLGLAVLGMRRRVR